MRARTAELNIFADRVRVRAPTAAQPSNDEAGPIRPPAPEATARAATLPGETERRIVEILVAPAPAWATIDAAFRHKEHELGCLFATLSVLEAGVLHRRLANPRSDDELAQHFLRLVADRRARLLAFLADARRRAARGGPSVHR
jgi:hypothetical protein